MNNSIEIKFPPKPNLQIWISDDLCYNCHGHYNWFHKIMVRLLLGWKVNKI